MPRLRALPPRLGKAPSRWPSQTKRTDPELGTAAHRTWARAVKERAGYRCEDPAHDPRQPRGGAGVAVYADHIEERRDAPGKALDISNGMCRCAACHTRKTHRARAERLKG